MSELLHQLVEVLDTFISYLVALVGVITGMLGR